MNEIIAKIKDLEKRINDAVKILKIDESKEKIKKLEKLTTMPDFWDNQNEAKKISQELSNLIDERNEWQYITKEISDLLSIAELDKKDKEVNMRKEIEKKYQKILKNFEKKEFLLLFNGEYDKNDAIVAIHAGTGGTDAQDWAEMLLRMISRYVEKKGYKAKIIDSSLGSEAGIKSAIIQIHGKYAYGNLKSENGVHRLVRISPFDAEKMRHTSFALIEVLPLLEDTEIQDVEVNTKDIKIDTYKSSGAGGQHVNKTESAVRITHLPTNITITCQNERSQLQNKETALKILQTKLFYFEQAKEEEEKKKLRGEYTEAAWGNHIRSYVLHPYKMVKDVRTKYETDDVQSVLDGNLEEFAESYLKWNNIHKSNKIKK